MADNQIILEFLANTDGLKAAAQQLQMLGNITKEQHDLFTKAGAENEKRLREQVKAQQQLSGAIKNMTGDAKLLSDQFRQLNQQIVSQSLGQMAVDFKASLTEVAKSLANLKSLDSLKDIRQNLQQVVDILIEARKQSQALADAAGTAPDAITQISSAIEVLNTVHETSNNLFGKEGLIANAASVAQSAYTAVVGQSTGALKLFRVALALTGIGMAVLLVYELATNWLKLGEAVDDTTGKLSKAAIAEEQTLAITKKANEASAREIAYAETLRNAINNQKLPRAERLKALVEYNKTAEHGNRLAVSEINNYERVNAQIDRQIKLLQAMSFVKAAQQILTEKVREQLDLELKSAEAQNAYEKQNAKDRENSIKGMAGDYDMTKRMSDLRKSIHATGKQISEKEIQDKKDEIAVVLSLIKKYQEDYKQLLLDVPPLTTHNFNEENARSFAAANQKWIADQKSSIQSLMDAEETRRMAMQAGSDEELASYSKIIELKKQMAELDYGFTSPDKLALTLAQLENEYQTYYGNVLVARNQSNQQALDELKLNHDLQLKLQQDFGLTQQQIDDEFAASSFKTFKEYEEKKREELQKTADENQMLAEFAIETAGKAISTIMEIEASHRQARLEADLSALESRKEAELKNKNLTEAQKDAINRRYAIEEGNLKRRAYEQDKQAKLAQAAINGALAITNILATRPKFDFGVGDAIMIGAAIASTAAQIALIASQPIPKFARGGKNIPAGMKLVGERGPELIYTPGGETVIPHGDTAKILEAWSIPMPNISDAVKSDIAIGMALPAGINYKKLAQSFAQELRNNPSVNVQLDSNGFGIHLMQKGKNVQLLNNRYSA